MNENPSYLGEENFGQVYGSNSILGEDMRQRKREQHSNQAQLTGEFMRQIWRIYGLSENTLFSRGLLADREREEELKSPISVAISD